MKFTFFYESKEYAGAEVQIIRIINELISIGHDVEIYDSGSIIIQNCPGALHKKNDEPIHTTDYLIYFACDILKIRKILNIKDVKKEVVWCVHPDNYFWIFPVFYKLKKSIKFLPVKLLKFFYPVRYNKVLKIISKRNLNLYFMDEMNYNSFKSLFGVGIAHEFLPIVPSQKKNEINRGEIGKSLNVLFVGRLVNFKVESLKVFITEVSKCNVFEKYIFTIIGTGPSEEILKFSKFNRNVKVIFSGNRYGKELIEISSVCDVAFAMGTSALDLSLLGLPVILSPISSSFNKYIWLHETKNYNMISTVDNNSLRDVNDILIELKFENQFIAQKCQSYTEDIHSIKNLINIILKE